MRRRRAVILVAAIVFAMNEYAANSWSVIHCYPLDAAEASGIRLLNEQGAELFRVCQDGEASASTIVGEKRSHSWARASIWRISVQTIALDFQEWSDA